ncbi:hypothetical protein SLS62_006291 [Diatrype stigma]|uniref:RING-type domain-containing protein n=1 Tax=Diatrype stigma TaxID=117547 RepID=A0AAN9YS34_9PEZI
MALTIEKICTELLFEPLTLLDCLHTFCGSCLTDWFRWQLTAAENSPNPPGPGAKIFTCPSCRAYVRDTRHNATVATLLDMFLTANPNKARSEEEKEEMRLKYKPGDNALPKVRMQDKSPEERRMEEMERRMLEQAREMSLREAGVETSLEARRARRRRDHSNPEDTRSRSDRESSRDPRRRDSRDQSRRGDGPRHQHGLSLDDRRRQHQRSISQDQPRDSSRTRRRHIEHQASIRSLISSSDIDSLDLEREIEDFARHIQEEGFLDGLNLDNIDDLSRNDELSRKITEAYRRRQRERSRQEPSRRGNASPATRPYESAQSLSRPSSSRPTSSRQRSSSANTRPIVTASPWEDRNRPPVTSNHLEVRSTTDRRPRRRTSSGGRSATDPVRPSSAETRPAARSQNDLTSTPQNGESSSHRPSISENRSSSMPTANSATQPPVENPTDRGLPFSARATAAQTGPIRAVAESSDAASQSRPRRSRRPSDLVVPQAPLPSLGLLPTSPTAVQHHRPRTQFYQEPSISCSRCDKSHIEYELHYNCATCRDGNWNLCLDCYRAGKGCLHWFGFGYAAMWKWERVTRATAGTGKEKNKPLEPPHVLTANRYNPPKHTPGGAEGRRTLTADDPALRLESGNFCARCAAWANECFWRCDACNEGDWGFCNTCVNQGYACTHPLLPLAYVAPAPTTPAPASPSPSPSPSPSSSPTPTPPGSSSSNPIPHLQQHHLTPPGSPRSPSPFSSSPSAPRPRRRPLSATLLPNPGSTSGNFQPLTFTTTCDVCRGPIGPAQHRYHCFACVSRVVPDTLPGDYDVCVSCYARLVQDGRIAPENGDGGWRRCLRGHRMAVVSFEDSSSSARSGGGGGAGQRRRVLRDVVGGVGLRVEPYQGGPAQGDDDEDIATALPLQKWSWKGGPTDGAMAEEARLERLVTVDVAATVPPRLLLAQTGTGAWTDQFPPEGGAGARAVARWSWYPQPGAADELLFPRGAEVREVEDVNGDWFHGSYMGAVGLFPSAYVRVVEGGL